MDVDHARGLHCRVIANTNSGKIVCILETSRSDIGIGKSSRALLKVSNGSAGRKLKGQDALDASIPQLRNEDGLCMASMSKSVPKTDILQRLLDIDL